jgi:hypothetical protein
MRPRHRQPALVHLARSLHQTLNSRSPVAAAAKRTSVLRRWVSSSAADSTRSALSGHAATPRAYTADAASASRAFSTYSAKSSLTA